MKNKVLLIVLTIMIFVGIRSVKAIRVSTPLQYKGSKPTNLEFYGGSRINFLYTNYYILKSTAGNSLFCLDPYHQVYTAGNYTNGPYSGNVCGIIVGLKGTESSALGTITTSDLDLIKSTATANINNSAYVAAYKKVQNYLWRYLYVTDCDTYVDLNVSNNTNASITISVNSGKELSNRLLEQSESGANFISKKITVTPSGIDHYNLELTGPDGIYLAADNNGAVGSKITDLSDLSGTKSFYIVLPPENYDPSSTSSIKLTASGNYVSKSYTRITPIVSTYTTSGYQKIGTVDYKKETKKINSKKTDRLTFYVSDERIIKIIKIDSETKEPIEGAKFRLYSDSTCSTELLLPEYTTTSEGFIILEGNLSGTNYVKETSAPANYVINNECRDFNADNEISEITFKNTRRKGSIIINKLDSKTSEGLKGVKFTLYSDSECKNAMRSLITDTTGKVQFTDLPYGSNYYVKETYAPDGYDIDDKSCKSVQLDQSTPYTFKDTPVEEEKPITKISKLDITNNKEVSDAKIEISNDKNDTVFKYTSSSTPYEVYLENLGEGYYYYLEETFEPKGYEKLETVFKFIINEFGEPELISVGKFEKDKDGNKVFKKSSNESDLIKIDGDTIIIYNTPLEVPVEPTGMAAKIIYTILGLVLVIAGGSLIYIKYFKNKKVNV